MFHCLRRAGLVALAWIWPTGAGWRRRIPAGSVAALFMGLTAVAAPNPVQPGEGELHAAPSTHAGGAPGGEAAGGGLMGGTDLANAAGVTLGLGAGTTDSAFSDAPGLRPGRLRQRLRPEVGLRRGAQSGPATGELHGPCDRR
jgi:hypothetical protein